MQHQVEDSSTTLSHFCHIALRVGWAGDCAGRLQGGDIAMGTKRRSQERAVSLQSMRKAGCCQAGAGITGNPVRKNIVKRRQMLLLMSMRLLCAIILIGWQVSTGLAAESSSLMVPLQAATGSCNYELRGVYELNGTWYFSLFQREENKSFWIDSRRSGPGLVFVSFEAERGLLTLECDGRLQEIALKPMGAWTSLAVPGGPSKLPVAAVAQEAGPEIGGQSLPPRRREGPSRLPKASLAQRREAARRTFSQRSMAVAPGRSTADGVAVQEIKAEEPQVAAPAGRKQLSDRLREGVGIRPAPANLPSVSPAIANE